MQKNYFIFFSITLFFLVFFKIQNSFGDDQKRFDIKKKKSDLQQINENSNKNLDQNFSNIKINYVWIVFLENLLVKIENLKKNDLNLKDLSIFEIIEEKLELDDFIINSGKTKYLDNLIQNSMTQNHIKSQVFFALLIDDDIKLKYNFSENEVKNLNESIKKIFSKDGKFDKSLSAKFDLLNKKNNIEFISFDEASSKLLEFLQTKQILTRENFLQIEKKINQVSNNLLGIDLNHLKILDKLKIFLGSFLLKKNIRLIKRTPLLDYFKSLSILYTNFVQSADVLFTDFDTLEKNLFQNFEKLHYEKSIKFSLINKYVYNLYEKYHEKVKTNYLNENINYSSKIKFFNSFFELFKTHQSSQKNFSFCHYGLLFVPEHFANFFLYLIKEDIFFFENTFDVFVCFLSENKISLKDFGFFENYEQFEKKFKIYHEEFNKEFKDFEKNKKIAKSFRYKKYINFFMNNDFVKSIFLFDQENGKIIIGNLNGTWVTKYQGD